MSQVSVRPGPSQPRGRLPGDRRIAIGGLCDVLALVLDLLHVALAKAVTHEFPVALICGIDDCAVAAIAEPLIASTAGTPKSSNTCEQPPEADAVAIFVPGPVRDVGHRRAAGRRRQHRARHRRVDVPFLDIDDDPHRQARPTGQFQALGAVIGE